SSGELSIAVSIARRAAGREGPIALAIHALRPSDAANAIANHSQLNYVTDRYRASRACHVCMPVQCADRPRSAPPHCGRRLLGINGLPSLWLPPAMRQMRAVRPSDAAPGGGERNVG